MIQENRALWKYIVFGLLTFGIYNFYFIYKMAQDVNTMCEGDGKKSSGLIVFILLSYLTFGIYALIWYYSLANRLAENAPRYELKFSENGTTVLMWHIFGMLLCGIGAYVAMHILIKNTNAMAKAYNAKTDFNSSRLNREQPQQTKFEQTEYGQNVQQIQSVQNQRIENPRMYQDSYTESETTVLSMKKMTEQGENTQPKGILYFVQNQQSITIEKDEFRIGKKQEISDYVITNDSSVSRQHAVIQRRNGKFYITDLDSTNGTFVNEQRISGTVRLQDGDNIRYANVISVFNILK